MPEKLILPSPSDTVVAMAVYQADRADWVQQAIESVLQQTWQHFVFYIVANGSLGQEINQVLQKATQADKRITVLRLSKNVGLSVAMNHVIDVCAELNPTYFFRMDADDICEPDRLAKQIAFFSEHPRVSVLGTGLTEVNESGEKVGKRKMPLTHGDIIKFLPKRCPLNHPTVGVRYQIFADGFRYRESLSNTQDYFFWIDLAAQGYYFANLSDYLLRFRRVNDFYKRRGLNKSLNEFKARLYAMQKLKRHTLGNVLYAFSVLCLRLMPSKVVKLAYKIDRKILEKLVKH